MTVSLMQFVSLVFFFLPDNTISVVAKHDTFRRQKQEMYFLPIVVTDNGNPPMSSTNTLTIRVCGCSKEGIVQSCNVEAYVLPIGLSMGALIAILACIVLLLGKLISNARSLYSNVKPILRNQRDISQRDFHLILSCVQFCWKWRVPLNFNKTHFVHPFFSTLLGKL